MLHAEEYGHLAKWDKVEVIHEGVRGSSRIYGELDK